MRPMITGTTAPPMIPVPKMPEKEPWNSATELRASDTTIGHITDANRPTAGKAMTETIAGPNKAADSDNRAPRHAPISTLRSEERRVGKEYRSRKAHADRKKKIH